MLVLTVTMILSTMIVAQADGNEVIYARDANLLLYADIDFVDGGVFSRDKYSYQVNLAGSDLDKVPTQNERYYVKIYNDEDEVVVSLYPYAGRSYLYGSKSYGFSSFFAVYKMRCYDAYTRGYAF